MGNKRIFMLIPDNTGCGFYRAVLPVVHCAADLAKEGIELVGSTELNPAEHFDAYIFHRIPNPKAFPFLEELRRRGSRIVWETDDALDLVPEWNPASKAIGPMEVSDYNIALDFADLILVTTEQLKWHLGPRRAGKTLVAPNLVDLSLFSRYDPVPGRVLWAGSVHHEKDLEILVPLVDRFPNLEWVFMGDCPEQLKDRVTFIPGVPLQNYFGLVSRIAPQIALCPLVDDPFNYCKSPLKWFEMSTIGAAVIASDMLPYSAVIDHGTTGLLVKDDWAGALVDCQEKAEGFAIAAGKQVADHHSWLSNARDRWLDAFRLVSLG